MGIRDSPDAHEQLITATTVEMISQSLRWYCYWYNPPGIAYRRNSVRSLIVAEYGDTIQREPAVAIENKRMSVVSIPFALHD